MQARNHAKKRRAACRVQPRGRLVKHQYARVHGQNARERHAALLAARQLERTLLGHLVKRQPHALKRLAHARIHLVVLQPQVARPERYVLVHGLGEQLVLGILEHHADAAAQAGLAALVGNVGAHNQHLSRRGLQDAVHVLDDGGLAAARVPGDAQKLALMHGERHVADGPQAVGCVAPFRLALRLLPATLALALGLGGIVRERHVAKLDERRAGASADGPGVARRSDRYQLASHIAASGEEVAVVVFAARLRARGVYACGSGKTRRRSRRSFLGGEGVAAVAACAFRLRIPGTFLRVFRRSNRLGCGGGSAIRRSSDLRARAR